jgi:hypothetical protein
MRILFDQATPVPARPYLIGHTVSTAAQLGWDRLQNGRLLSAAEEAGFEILLTTDKNMRYQQNCGPQNCCDCSRATTMAAATPAYSKSH